MRARHEAINILSWINILNITWIPGYTNVEGIDKADELTCVGAADIAVTIDCLRAFSGCKSYLRQWNLGEVLMQRRLQTDQTSVSTKQKWKLGRVPSAECRACTEQNETLEHYLCKCPAYSRLRSGIFHGVSSLGRRNWKKFIKVIDAVAHGRAINLPLN